MPRLRSDVEKALGLLLSSIQKEWLGETESEAANESEAVMYKCENLLHAAKIELIPAELRDRSVVECLGQSWVALHPNILPSVQAVDSAVLVGKHA